MSKLLGLLFFIFCSINLSAQSTDLLIQKTGDATALFGEHMSYTITISNSGTTVSNASFLDNFPLDVSNVSLVSCVSTGGAVCPSLIDYTLSNTSFSGIIPSLPHASSVTFVISLNAPNQTNGLSSISNTATVHVPAGFIELDPSTNSSTWNTTLITDVDLGTQISSNNNGAIGSCTNLPFTSTYTVQWFNNGISNDYNTELEVEIFLSNINILSTGNTSLEYHYEISNVQWSSSNSLTTPVPNTSFTVLQDTILVEPNPPNLSQLQTTILPSFIVGDTVTLVYTITFTDYITTGCNGDYEFSLSNLSSFEFGNTSLNDTNGSNNSGIAFNLGGLCDDFPVCPSTDIGTQHLISTNDTIGDCLSYPFIIDYEITWFNNGIYPDTNTMLQCNISLDNIVALGLGNSVYSFPFKISNVNWTSNLANAYVPTNSFINLMDTFLVAYQNNSTITNGIAQLDSVFVPLFEVGDSITLSFQFMLDTVDALGCGSGYVYELWSNSFYTMGSQYLMDTIGANNSDLNIYYSGSCDLLSVCNTIDIEVLSSSSVVDTIEICNYPLEIDYDVQWINNGPLAGEDIDLFNLVYLSDIILTGSGNATFEFPYSLSNVMVSSVDTNTVLPAINFFSNSGTVDLSNTSAITNLSPTTITYFAPGDTLNLSYTVTIDEPITTGCGNSLNFNIGNGAFFTHGNTTVIESNTSNNSSFLSDGIGGVTSIDLAISESVNPAIVNHLDTTEITVLFLNASDVSEANASWSQILPAYFEIIQSSIVCTPVSGVSACGPITYDPITREIRQTVPNLGANSSIEIKFKGVATSVNSRTVNLEAIAENNCIDCIPATNFTQTTFQINGLCELAFAGELATAAISCFNSNDGTATILTSGVTIGTLHYEWFDSLGNNLGQDSSTAIGLSPGVYSVVVNDDAVFGCEIIEFITVPCLGLFAPNSVNDIATTLEDDSVTFNVLGNDTDTDGIIDSSSVDLDPNTPGVQDTIQTAEGLWYVDSLGNVSFVPNQNFEGTAGILYVVNDNDSLNSNISTIIVTVLGVNDAPFANVDSVNTNSDASVVIAVLNNDTDSIDPNGGFNWNTLDVVTPPVNGTISIDTLTGEITYVPNGVGGLDSFLYVICDNGNPELCDTAWVYIQVTEVEAVDCSLRFPEGISPNNDGLNDVWYIGNLSCYPNNKLQIFNRWGFTIYEGKPYNNDWDGTNNYYKQLDGQLLPVGTYFYIFETGEKGQKPVKGFIYLTR